MGTDCGPGSLTESGYPRIVKEWRRGTPLSEAATIFEGEAGDMSVSAHRDHTPGFERDIISRQVTFFTQEVRLLRDGKLVRLEVPDDARTAFWREWMLLSLRSDWEAGGSRFAAGALIAIRLEEFLKGERRFTPLFEPKERVSLSDFSCTRGRLLINVLDNVSNRLFVLEPPKGKGKWSRKPLPGVPDKVTAAAWPLDPLESDEYLLILEGYLNPSTGSLGIAGGGPAEKLKSSPAFFETGGLAVTRHEATSKDGTLIPYFQVGREDLKLDGSSMTLMTGYGGFEIAMMPYYSPLAGQAWLERG